MIAAGIDVGARTAKAVIVNNGRVLAKALVLCGRNKGRSAEEALEEAAEKARIPRKNIGRVVATGSGAKRAAFAQEVITEAGADARGVNRLLPSARTIIDVGAEEGRAVKCNAEGRVLDYAINEKCAAGAGTFVETMARALETKLEDMGALSLQSTKEITMNAQCAVFGESEVVSLIHTKVPKADIARAVHDAMAGRIGSVARIVGIEKDVALIGGVARNVGFVASLKKDLGVDLLIPEEPEFVGALGAAITAESAVPIAEEVKVKVVAKPE